MNAVSSKNMASTPGYPNSLLDLAHVLHSAGVDAIFFDDTAFMQHVELLGGLLPGEQHDRFLATRVVLQKVGHIVYVLSDDDPAIGVRAVFGDFFFGDRHGQWWPKPTTFESTGAP